MGIEFINDKIDNLGLSRGLMNSLIAYGSIDTISALTTYSAADLKGVPNIGTVRIREIELALEKFGLKLSEKDRGTPRMKWTHD